MVKHDHRKSRKGLVALTRKKVSFGDDRFRMEWTGASSFELLGPNSRDEARKLVDVLRDRASATIVNAGKDPEKARAIATSGDQVDVACLAAKVLLKLQMIEHLLSRLDMCSEMKVARSLGHEAALEALRAGLLSSALDTVENEVAIVAMAESIAGARQGGRARVRRKQARDKEMAREFRTQWERRGEAGRSRTAMMVEIGKKQGLGRTASVDAINRGLRLISSP